MNRLMISVVKLIEMNKLICLIIIGSLIVVCSSLITIHPDTGLSITDLVTKYGYPIESHEVLTEDGYILTVHRIPYGKESPPGDKQKPPILLMHSLLTTSAGYVNQGPNKSIGFLLADNGFDVWMGNQRGNFWGRKHISIDPDKENAKFFNFSIHEIGVIDIPTTIDYILNNTKQDKINYLGHSQGCTAFFMMCAERPEYNDKIKVMIGLGPAAYIHHMKNPWVRVLAEHLPTVEGIIKKLYLNEVLPSGKLFPTLSNLFCVNGSPFQELCATVLFLFAGFDSPQLDRNFFTVITTTAPAGASVGQIFQLLQFVRNKNFTHYDYGVTGNMIKYGQDTPPVYDLKKITAPVILHGGPNDWLVDPIDVDLLADTLPNVVKKAFVSLPLFNHLDFIWSIDIVKLINNEIIMELKSIN